MSDLSDLTHKALLEDTAIVAEQEKQENFQSEIYSHLVFIIHGLHDPAEWQEGLKARLEASPDTVAKPFKYGYFDLVRFILIRKGPIIKLSQSFESAANSKNIANISVIAHSFGTYVLSKVLNRNCNNSTLSKKLFRIVLCGSIIPNNYKWHIITDASADSSKLSIINDCGVKDDWPMWAKFLGCGYGSSGREGFGCYDVLDRYHNFGHGGFFNNDFIDEYWIPFLTKGHKKNGLTSPPAPKKYLSILTIPFFRLTTILFFWVPAIYLFLYL